MNNKLILPLVVLIIIVVVGGLVWMDQKQAGNNSQTGQGGQDAGQNFDPRRPNFVLGELVSVSAEKMEVAANGKTITAEISSATKLEKQVKDKKGIVSNTAATLADFKAKQMVVVYFSANPTGDTYKADKIQIISIN